MSNNSNKQNNKYLWMYHNKYINNNSNKQYMEVNNITTNNSNKMYRTTNNHNKQFKICNNPNKIINNCKIIKIKWKRRKSMTENSLLKHFYIFLFFIIKLNCQKD